VFPEGQHEFKIKKSSHSKKIAKQLKKELQKEKEEKERAEKLKKENDKSPPPPARNYSTETLKASSTIHFLSHTNI
jgi:cell shape-determining protein MreC